MADKKKSIIEEAVFEAKRIQETLNANTKGILRSIAKEEIDELVKESLNEDYDEEDVDDTETTDLEVDADAEAPVDGLEDVGADTSVGMDDEMGTEMGDSEEGGLEGYEDEMGAEASYGDEMDMTAASDDEVIAVYKKLTGDDEIQIVSNENGDIELTVNEPGEFVIKANGGGADMGSEMAPEMGTEMAPEMEPEMEPATDLEAPAMEPEMEPAMGGEEEEEEVEYESYDVNESQVVYEIAIDEMEDIESVSAPVGSEKSPNNWAGDNLEGGFDDDGQNGTGDNHGEHVMETEDVTEGEEITEEDVNEDEVNEEAIEESIPKGKGEAHRIPAKADIGQPVAPGAKGVHGVKGGSTNEGLYVSKADYDKLLKEAKALNNLKVQMTATLKEQRAMLGKVVVFNTNLTNVTRLFTEHTTTKEEKRNIIERFDDEVSNIHESKKLFKTIEKELSSKTPISESVEGKFSKETSSSASKINESTAYVDKDTKRIMDLMRRVENPEKY